MSNKLKRIFAGIMIAGDGLLISLAASDFFSGIDTTAMLFIIAFLGIDAFLSVDYIMTLKKQEQEEREYRENDMVRMTQETVRNELNKKKKQRKMDREMAEELRSAAPDKQEEIDPDELAEMLSEDIRKTAKQTKPKN